MEITVLTKAGEDPELSVREIVNLDRGTIIISGQRQPRQLTETQFNRHLKTRKEHLDDMIAEGKVKSYPTDETFTEMKERLAVEEEEMEKDMTHPDPEE